MTIKNAKLLEGLLSSEQSKKLDLGAGMHQRNARIHFKILEVGPDFITVQVVQTKSPAENYLSAKDLADRAKDLFGRFFPDRKIHARPSEYVPPSVDHVTPEWLKKKLEIKGMGQVEVVTMTGISKSNSSSWLSGSRPMTQIAKSMFYFILK